jgi:four helix bundle protein
MQLAERAVALTRRLPPEERFGMRSQITRCATSVPSNIAEGWVRDSWKDKVRFLSIAHGSLAELNTQRILCRRIRWLTPAEADDALRLANEVAKMLTTLKQNWRRHTPQASPLSRKS